MIPQALCSSSSLTEFAIATVSPSEYITRDHKCKLESEQPLSFAAGQCAAYRTQGVELEPSSY